jgi:hypothetical protein
MGADPIDLMFDLRSSKEPAGEIRWTNLGGSKVFTRQSAQQPGDGDNVAVVRPSSSGDRHPIVGIPRTAGSAASVHPTERDTLNASDRVRTEPECRSCACQWVKDMMKLAASGCTRAPATRSNRNCDRVPLLGGERSWQFVKRSRDWKRLNP